MLYGSRYFGVVEANYAIALIHLVTFALGPSLWRLPLLETALTGPLDLADVAVTVFVTCTGTVQVRLQIFLWSIVGLGLGLSCLLRAPAPCRSVCRFSCGVF